MKFLFFIFFTLFCLRVSATSYYMSTTGNDNNNGTSIGTSWASPNHAVNCGDTITAAAGTYNQLTTFGVSTCTAGNNVAWLQCATPFACVVNVSTGGQYAAGIAIGQSYWGVRGWVVTTYSGGGACFFAYPVTTSTTIHHIIFANDIANGCGQNGFDASPNTTAGVDYLAYVGDIAYNAAQGSNNCTSGFNIFEPVASDTLPGTHVYIAGNFAWGNVDPATCNGTSPTDGEGIITDTINGLGYKQQIVIDNNLVMFNGSRGIQPLHNTTGSISVYIRHNTAVDDNASALVNLGLCAEILFNYAAGTEAYLNLVQTGAATCYSGTYTNYAFQVNSVDGTSHIYNNYGYSAAGNNMGATGTNTGFSYGPSNTFANPVLHNAIEPSSPSCSAFTTTTSCMAQVISNFTATVNEATSYGYQTPGETSIYDPLFPQWLCNVNLPNGLVNMGCVIGNGSTASSTTNAK